MHSCCSPSLHGLTRRCNELPVWTSADCVVASGQLAGMLLLVCAVLSCLELPLLIRHLFLLTPRLALCWHAFWLAYLENLWLSLKARRPICPPTLSR